MIRIFSKDRKELHSDIDTWVVKWTTYKASWSGIKYPEVKEFGVPKQEEASAEEAEETEQVIDTVMMPAKLNANVESVLN